MIQVSELKGIQSLHAFNAYNSLLMGLKMIPEYMSIGFEDFLKMLDGLESEAERRKILTTAARFVKLEEDELNALISFCSDSNGVPYGKENLKNLKPEELVDVIVSVCLKMSEIKVDLVTEAEKKKSETGQLI
jgi:hypothetical protein